MDNHQQDQKNLFLAMVLSGIILLGYWFVFGKPAAELAQKQAELERATIESVQSAPAPQPILPREVLVTQGQRIKIDTPSLTGSFLTTGSRFDDISLKKYDETLDKADGTVELLTPEGAERSAYIMDNWTGISDDNGADTPWQLVSGSTLTPSAPVVLSYENNGLNFNRTITIDEDYLITLSDKVTNVSDGERTITRKGVTRQHTLPENLIGFLMLHEGPISVVDSTHHDYTYKKLKKNLTWEDTGEAGWVGLTDKYWLLAAIAPQGKTMKAAHEYRTINDQEVYESSYALSPTTLTAGASIESVGHIFVGAKERKLLKTYENDLGISKMTLAIDWGVLGIIVKPMTWALSHLGALIGNYGIAIMILITIIKILLFPLFNKQYESQAKMKKVQPKLKKLQNLYKDDRQKLQQEMMGLYRKEGVNPAAGCLPIIPTMFVFFAFYKTVLINVDMRHAPFFGWIKDLSARDPLSILNGFGILPWDGFPSFIPSLLAIGPLAILYGISMSMIYTLTPQNAGAGEQAEMMAKMMKWMPWIFMFILAGFEASLLVYWIWNNVLSFGQQYYITRKFKVDTPVDKFFRKITGKEAPANTK